MAGQSKITSDHKEIQDWVEKRGGSPAVVKQTQGKTGNTGVLRFIFDKDQPDDTLQEINWDEFFTTFDDKNLALLYQDETSTGKLSRFFKFIKRPE